MKAIFFETCFFYAAETKQKRLQAVSNGLLHEDCKDEEEKG